MNRFFSAIADTVRNHPYATAAGSIVAAELLRSRNCERSLVSDVVTIAAIGATVNAGYSAAGGVSRGFSKESRDAVYAKGAADEHDRLRVEGRLIMPNPGGLSTYEKISDAFSAAESNIRRTRSALGLPDHGLGTAERHAVMKDARGHRDRQHALKLLFSAEDQLKKRHAGAAKPASFLRNVEAAHRKSIEAAHVAGISANPSMLENPRYAASGTGLLTGLPVVKRSAYHDGNVLLVSHIGDKTIKKKGRPYYVGIASPKGVGKDELVVLGRDNAPHLIKRQCGSRSGKPGAALSTGKYAGCGKRDAGRVLGLKSWRDSGAFTEGRELSSLRNLTFAFRAQGMAPPPEITRRIAQLKARNVEPTLTQAARRGRLAAGR